jgi:S1-C subfamily serine protease
VINLLVSAFLSTGWAQEGGESLTDMPLSVYNKVSPVTVKITCNDGEKVGSGAVIAITKSGLRAGGQALVLTACHVVSSNFEMATADPDLALSFYDKLEVKASGELSSIPARVLQQFVDRSNDIALILTEYSAPGDEVVAYINSDAVKPGQKVAAFGFPETDQLSQTVGRVTRVQGNYLVFDAAIAPGSSGGPLVDDAGRMVGVSTYTIAGEGYALSINLVSTVVNPWLGGARVKKVWEYKEDMPIWQRAYKDWRFIAGEALILGFVTSAILRPDSGPKDLPEPPSLP